jgi:uncharacterized protein (DUF433 family)
MAKAKLKHPYVTQIEGVCGGKPVIKGTRIRVMDIAIEHKVLGYTPEQIIQAHPHLNLAQVHDALSYYYENQEMINKEIEKAKETEERYKKRYPSKLKNGKNQDILR